MRSTLRFLALSSTLIGGVVTTRLVQAHTASVRRLSNVLVRTPVPRGSVATPRHGPHPGSRGSSLIVSGDGLLVSETNAGVLVSTDDEGRPLHRLTLHEGVAQVVRNASGPAYVADRRAHRVVRVDVDGSSLEVDAELAVTEPYGLALSADGNTLLVTSVANGALLAFDTETMTLRWRVSLAPEPRGVSLSSDGTRATVGFLSTGALATVSLDEGQQVHWHSLNPRDPIELHELPTTDDDWDEDGFTVAAVAEARSRFEVPTDQGRRHARSVFSVAYLANDVLAAPHLLSIPQLKRIPVEDMEDSYGGGPAMIPAIRSRLALIANPGPYAMAGEPGISEIHQPRAVGYDGHNDTLYVAGYGNDRIAAIADASQPTAYFSWIAKLELTADEPSPDGGTKTTPQVSARRTRARHRRTACGPDGITTDGTQVWVHCELARRVVRLAPSTWERGHPWKPKRHDIEAGPVLAPSQRSPAVERGAELFRRGRDSSISDLGVMACSSCHPEGRQDGLSWRLGKSILQTPMLAGRLEGTAPYKWSGEDADLETSFRHTVERLGGAPDDLADRDYQDLAAYVLSLPAPVAPPVRDANAVARGQSLFEQQLDCVSCHRGTHLTDAEQYPLGSRGLEVTDTPSLVGLRHSAPYYHDGSAEDLHALVADRSNVHDMADFSSLDTAQAADLVAYLETL